MNVALMIDDTVEIPPKNGVTARFYNAAKHLLKYPGIHVFIADRGGTEVAKMSQQGFRATIFPSKWLYDAEKFPLIASLFREKNIKIIHVCNSHTMVPVYGFQLCNALNASLVCDMHDIYADLLPKDRKYDQARFNENLTQRIVGKYADRVGVISRIDMERLASGVVDPQKMYWAPVGIESRETVRSKRDTQNVVFVGNMFYGPNYEAAKLISKYISPAVKEECPNAIFSLIGNAPEDIASLKNVVHLGPQDDLAPHFNKASVGLAPLNNGSGMKVKMLDYASFGLPVVGTTIAAMGYEENDGFIITDDYPTFVSQIVGLLKSPQLAQERGKAGKEYIDRNFSWYSIVQRQYQVYCDLYQEHLGRSSPVSIPFKLSASGHVEVNGFLLEKPQHLAEERYQMVQHLQKEMILRL
ncbi:MAG: glycosyltransferase family 4 protein [Alphaproteobacteria bacterium]|nr:glycosyltransferase family 4 protein [Alphaproteobacteria bacterium]